MEGNQVELMERMSEREPEGKGGDPLGRGKKKKKKKSRMFSV